MKNILLIAFLSVYISACAQTKYGIAKASAYYSERTPAAQAINDKGVRESVSDTMYTVYLQVTNLSKPTWKHAWINGKSYNILPNAVKGNYVVGSTYSNDKKVTIVAKKGYTLWQLNLEPSVPETKMPADYKYKINANTILLQGLLKQQKIYYTVAKPVQLMSPLYE